MSRSRNRQLNKYKERSLAKLDTQISNLEAAYYRATNIPPQDACLVHHVEPLPDNTLTTRYWFEARKKTDMGDCHPSVQFLFELAVKISTTDNKKEELEAIETLKTHIRANYIEEKADDNDGTCSETEPGV